MEEDQRGVDGDGLTGTTSARPTFLNLYRRYVTPIYSYVYSRTSNRADAEDLTEQVFVEALAGLERYEKLDNAAGWLFTIAHRRVVDYYRSHREEHSFDEWVDSPLDRSGPEAEVMRREQLALLERLVAALDAEERELLQLRFVAELSYREIGDVVGRSEGAVKLAIYRLLETLRARWSIADVIGEPVDEAGAGSEEVAKDA